MERYDLLVLGGGAAGVFGAICAKEARPSAKVALFEKSGVLLSKVRISGGGRCNVTHACFEPKELVKKYPRGEKELLGPFHTFQPRDTIAWFEAQGVRLKTESDGRIFPVTDSSETIIHALLKRAKEVGVEIFTRRKIPKLEKRDGIFDCGIALAKTVLLATGSASEGHFLAQGLGHTIEPPLPSLFTFNMPHSPLKELSGISVDLVSIHIEGSTREERGPLLITHFGLSGPAILKLSAWQAPLLHAKNYTTSVFINWAPQLKKEEIYTQLLLWKKETPLKEAAAESRFFLPKNLWKTLLIRYGVQEGQKWRDLSDKQLQKIAERLNSDQYQTEGKTTHKEEFVTCGGVRLKEVNFKTMESKICPGLFFAGEILDIDGVTGGFNFQNAWTTGFIAGRHSQAATKLDIKKNLA